MAPTLKVAPSNTSSIAATSDFISARPKVGLNIASSIIAISVFISSKPNVGLSTASSMSDTSSFISFNPYLELVSNFKIFSVFFKFSFCCSSIEQI